MTKLTLTGWVSKSSTVRERVTVEIPLDDATASEVHDLISNSFGSLDIGMDA